MFTPPQVKALVGRFDESKHRRGQPENAGEFASGGGGSRSAGPSKTPRLGIFVSSGPSKPKPSGAKPPALPAGWGAKPAPSGKRPAAPGTGKPPKNLGSPTSPQEATDQLIWLLGRVSNLRRQAREEKPLTKKETKEMVLAMNLASRLHYGLTAATEAAAEAEKTGEIRPNPALDAVFASPTESKPKKPTGGDIRHNPDLDAFMAGKGLAWLPPILCKMAESEDKGPSKMTREIADLTGDQPLTSDMLDDGLHHHFIAADPEASAKKTAAKFQADGMETEIGNEAGLWSVEVMMDGKEHMIHFLPAGSLSTPSVKS